MAKTISFHNGSTWSRGHNVRDKRFVKAQAHIDNALSKNNEVIVDEVVRKAYDRIFGAAVAEYNLKQTRSDRKIKNYYEKIKKDKKKHVVYECIVQIGDKDDTENNAPAEKAALRRFAENWKKRNPRLEMIGAYIHADEPDGTVHLHIDYIPVAECSRGMALQNSLDRALQQQGFKTENIKQTAQIAWQDSERKVLMEICKEMNIDVQKASGAVTQGRQHLSKPEYQKLKEDAKQQMDEELEEYREIVDGFLKSEPENNFDGENIPTAAKFVIGKENKDKVLVTPSEIEELREVAKSVAVLSAENKQKNYELFNKQINVGIAEDKAADALTAAKIKEEQAEKMLWQAADKADIIIKEADDYAARQREFYAEHFPYVQQLIDEKEQIKNDLQKIFDEKEKEMREIIKNKESGQIWLAKDRDSYMNISAEQRQEIEKLKDRIREMSGEIQSVVKKNDDFSERVRVLENELKEKENALTECREEIRELTEQEKAAEEIRRMRSESLSATELVLIFVICCKSGWMGIAFHIFSARITTEGRGSPIVQVFSFPLLTFSV